MVLWKRTFYRNDDLSKPGQCRQLQLNPLSTQINTYCLITNQTPALLVQYAPWTRAAVMLLQSLYFSRPPPPRATCIISDVRPLGHLKIKMAAIAVRHAISQPWSHGKIGDCEQSISLSIPWARLRVSLIVACGILAGRVEFETALEEVLEDKPWRFA